MSVQVVKDTPQPLVEVAKVVNSIPVTINAVKSVNLVEVYKKLSDTEKEEIKTWFEKEFDLIDDSVEKTIEVALKVLLDANDAVNALTDGVSISDVFTLLAVLKKVQASIGTKP